jgi:hypothetical protein
MRRFLFGRPRAEMKAIGKSPNWIYRIRRIFCLPEPTAIYYADHHR